jgi:hypothetical protein
MDMVNIEELYMKGRKQSGLTGIVPEEVDKLVLKLFDDAYYQGLQFLSLEEYIGALITAGICVTVPEKQWRHVIPVVSEFVYSNL